MDTNITQLRAIHARLEAQSTLWADELLAHLHTAREMEEQYETELCEASLFANKLIVENSELKNEVAYLKTFIRPTIVLDYPDEQ
jgi:hypothetical protein